MYPEWPIRARRNGAGPARQAGPDRKVKGMMRTIGGVEVSKPTIYPKWINLTVACVVAAPFVFPLFDDHRQVGHDCRNTHHIEHVEMSTGGTVYYTPVEIRF